MRQKGDNTFVDILNALRIGQINAQQIQTLKQYVSKDESGPFAIDQAIRIFPTCDQVEKHNKRVLESYRGIMIIIIK